MKKDCYKILFDDTTKKQKEFIYDFIIANCDSIESWDKIDYDCLNSINEKLKMNKGVIFDCEYDYLFHYIGNNSWDESAGAFNLITRFSLNNNYLKNDLKNIFLMATLKRYSEKPIVMKLYFESPVFNKKENRIAWFERCYLYVILDKQNYTHFVKQKLKLEKMKVLTYYKLDEHSL